MMALWILLILIGLGFPPKAQAADEPLAEVDGVAISSEEVEKSLAGQLSKLEEQIYNLKRQKLDALINEKLLAKEAAKRKLTVPALLDAEVTSKVGLVTEQEIEKFYQENKAQIKGEPAEAREKIHTYLQNQINGVINGVRLHYSDFIGSDTRQATGSRIRHAPLTAFSWSDISH